MSVRKIVALVVALVVVAAAAIGAMVLLRDRGVEQGAAQAASRYLDLVSGAEESDLPELWAMTASDGSYGAMRDAGRMLVASTERIEVVSIGEPKAIQAGTKGIAWFDAEEYWEVPAQIRLRDDTVSWPILLGRVGGTSGREVEDWRVIVTNYPALDWSSTDERYGADRYVSGIRQTRMNTSARVSQPLYPAVYQVQQRSGPWFASEVADAVALYSPSTYVPRLFLDPTPKMADWSREQVRTELRSCAGAEASWLCPTESIARTFGLNASDSGNWWLGVSRVPTMQVERDRLTMLDGAVRIRFDGQVRTVQFGGVATYGVPSGDSMPSLNVVRWDVVQ